MNPKDNSISLKTAIKWTTEWRSEESDYNKYNKCNAFLIPAEDLAAVLKEIKHNPGVKKVRAYLGVDHETHEEKLILVGTQEEKQKDGSVIYRDIINNATDSTSLADGDSGIWDFSKPCPPECDPNSPLN